MGRLSTVVLLASVVVLFIPEPITSLVGVVGILAGIALRVFTGQ